MRVPYVDRCKTGSGHSASVGWALEALMATSPAGPPGTALQHEVGEMHRASTALLQLLSRWEPECSLELHLTSRPSLEADIPPRILIGIRLSVLAETEGQALEHCLAQYVFLGPLLNQIWPKAEFRTISNVEEWKLYFAPFSPGSCQSLGQETDRVSLAHPLRWGCEHGIGFHPATPRQSGKEPDAIEVEHCRPWVPAGSDWCLLLDMLNAYPVPQWLLIRAANRARVDEALDRCEQTVAACEKFLASSTAVTLVAQTNLLRDTNLTRAVRLRVSALRGAVLVLAPGPADPGLGNLVAQAISGDPGRGFVNNPYEGGFRIQPIPPAPAAEPFGYFEPEPFSANELACAFRLPIVSSERDHGLPVRRHRVLPLQHALFSSHDQPKTRLAINRWRGLERAVEVPHAHRLKHTFVAGMTGTGKSTFLLSMILQDLEQGSGVFLLDPHGDLVHDVLARFPRNRTGDLILIDLGDRERPVPLNLLAWKSLPERDLIVEELLSSVRRTYSLPEAFGPLFETQFRAMMRLLMGDNPERDFKATLLEFPMLYQDKNFRNYLLQQTKDEQIKDLIKEAEGVSGEWALQNVAPYITTKLGRFLNDMHMRRILGHGDMVLDFESVLAENRVVLIKLGRGEFSASVADLLMSNLVARLRLAAMRRAAVPREQRKPYFLYVDEFGTMARDETFSQLLSEARKYGLGLTLTTQYTAQLQDFRSGQDNLSALLGNVGTIVSFRVGPETASVLEPAFAPAVTASDLLNCPNFEGYIRLHIPGAVVPPFSFRTEVPSGGGEHDRARKIASASRQRWGKTADECERQIRQRRKWIDSVVDLS